MLKLDKSFLEGMGLGDMPEGQKEEFLAHLQEELEVRIGEKLGEGLTDAQLSEFERIMGEESNSEAAVKWLEQNCPNYKEMVLGEMEGLKKEIITNRETLLDSPDQGASS